MERDQKLTLDAAQKEAAAHFRGPCMVLSGPGSGKTTVITQRVKMLVETHNVPPEEILVVTFTKAAAEEMKERFLKLVSAEKTAVLFGTFHSVFYMILRAESFPEVLTVVEGRERLEILREALRSTDLEAEADQDYLNAMCKGRVKYLDISWNTMPTSESLSKEKLKIVHYNLFFKPWHYDGTRYEEYFWEYANRSSFAKDIHNEKKNFAKNNGKTDEERLNQMSQRVMEILESEITFKKVFNGEVER